jgi:hypothetical protein
MWPPVLQNAASELLGLISKYKTMFVKMCSLQYNYKRYECYI